MSSMTVLDEGLMFWPTGHTKIVAGGYRGCVRPGFGRVQKWPCSISNAGSHNSAIAFCQTVADVKSKSLVWALPCQLLLT